MVTFVAIRVSLSGVANTAASPSQPVQRQRRVSRTPLASSCASHARRSGEAFIATGKTRPVEPVKTSCPKPFAQAITFCGPKSETAAISWGAWG